MVTDFISWLDHLDGALWTYICVPMMALFGAFLSLRARFPQLTKSPAILSAFVKSLNFSCEGDGRGVKPLQAFFTSIGGCIGIGNIIAVCTAVQIGGPGAIFWMWIAAFLGMTVKYSEIYLGVKYRIPNEQGGYDGGPMYFLRKVFKTPFLPLLVAGLLIIYGTDVYMFNVVTNSITVNWHLNHYLVIVLLLALTFYTGSGGVARVGKVCSVIIPVFLVIYFVMSTWVLIQNAAILPAMFKVIITSAFSGHAALGAFAGSSMMLAVSQGLARASYSGDIGVGYASIIHAESSAQDPTYQAKLAIVGIFLDTFVVCTLTVFVILATGVWHESIPATLQIQTALSQYFPMMNIFMPIFIFLLGFSSMIAFFCVGLKCANYLMPKGGGKLYYVYAFIAFFAMSFMDQTVALMVMSISGALLFIINIFGIFRLRDQVEF